MSFRSVQDSFFSLLWATNQLYRSRQTCNSNNNREEESHEERNKNQNKLPFGERVQSHLHGPNSKENKQHNQQWLKKFKNDKHSILLTSPFPWQPYLRPRKNLLGKHSHISISRQRNNSSTCFVQNSRGRTGNEVICRKFAYSAIYPRK